MGKDKTFAAKLAKAAGGNKTHCPECGETFTALHVIETVKNEEKDSYKFKEGFVGICKCNQNTING